MPVIYKITSKTSNKSYIGQTKYTSHKRWLKHVEKAMANREERQCWGINNAIRKYGKDDFVVEDLHECEESELDQLEIQSIELYNTMCPNGYNVAPGGTAKAGPWREESKDKLSNVRRKHKDYDLPRSVIQLKDLKRNIHGFIVKTPGKSYTFASSSLSMDEKFSLAIKCYESIKSGKEYNHQSYLIPNGHKGMQNNHEGIPMYVSLRGETGFRVSKPGHAPKEFLSKRYTREQNLQRAITYLKSL